MHVTLFLDVMGFILPYPTSGIIYFCGKQKGYIYKLINVVFVGIGIEGKSYNFHNNLFEMHYLGLKISQKMFSIFLSWIVV